MRHPLSHAHPLRAQTQAVWPVLASTQHTGWHLQTYRRSRHLMCARDQPPPPTAGEGIDESDDESADPLACFREPGGEFEIDFDELEELLDTDYAAARARWQADGYASRRVGVLDDRASLISQWWHDPIEGPLAEAERYQAAAALRRRVTPIVRASLVSVIVGSRCASAPHVHALCTR